MLIKFGLANGAGGMAAAHTAAHVRKHLRAFEQQTNCTVRTWHFHQNHRHWIGAEVPKTHELLFQVYWTKDMSFMGYEAL